MEVSKITFTKETKEKMKKGLNPFQKGKLRWEKLKELDNSGRLSFIHDRGELIEAMGFEPKSSTGYAWACNLIKRKHLTETLTGFNNQGRPEYEYHLGAEPNYGARTRGSQASNNVTPKPTMPMPAPILSDIPTNVNEGKAKVVIRYKELVIELEHIDSQTIENIVSKLADK